MKLFHLTWVLALAGALAACNSGDPIEGCQVDPVTGQCEEIGGGGPPVGGPGGSGGDNGSGGSGGSGGDSGVMPLECGNTGVTALFDLSNSIFKAYSSLLGETTGSGEPNTDCAVPDLSDKQGADIAGSTTKCIIVEPPGVSGCLELDDTGSGWNVTGQQQLSFVIQASLGTSTAVITTNSLTEFTGTGTGASPGTITLDDIGDGFNMNVEVSGIVNCTATDGSGNDASATLCPAAGLMPGDNALPLPTDPLKRSFPPITSGADTFELGAGLADPTGWYLSNPGSGTQFVGLAGAKKN